MSQPEFASGAQRTHSKQYDGGAVAVVALFSTERILLIREKTKPEPHYWKLLSETIEPQEPILSAVWGALEEEAGMQKLRCIRDRDGEVIKIQDPRILNIRELLPKEWVKRTRKPHWRHIWGALTTNEVIMDLSGEFLNPEPDEELETRAFMLANVYNEEFLLPHHRDILMRIAQQ